MNDAPNKRLVWLTLGAILAIAATFRIVGIRWGLPDPSHYFSFHPDEWVILGYTLGLDFPRGQIDPNFYNYGTVYLYLLHLALLVGSTYGWITFPTQIEQHEAVASLYLAGRWLSVAMGVATCWLTWEIGRRVCYRWCGALAALLLAITPLHAQHSHFLTTDSTATFFTTAVLLAAILLYQSGGWRALFTAGVMVGLASATRYNAALVMIAPLFALWLRARDKQEPWLKRALILVAVSILTFLVFCPGPWVNPQRFWADLSYESRHVREGHGLVFVNTGLGWVYHYWHNLRYGLGLPLLLLSTLGVVVAYFSRRPALLIVWLFMLMYYLFLGSFAVRFARYLLPILPPLMVLCAWMVVESWRAVQGVGRVLVVGISGGVIVYTLLWGGSVVSAMIAPDPRLRALEWIQQHVPPRAQIGFATIPWYYTPPISPYFGELEPGRRVARAHEVQQYRLIVPQHEWDAAVLQRAQFVIVSQYEVDDAVRAKHASALTFLERLRSEFHRVAQFDANLRLDGIRFSKRGIPHDMLYPFPRVEIWQRR